MFTILLLGAITTSSAILNSVEAFQCSVDQFECKNQECIDLQLKCNGFNNCEDGSDEIGCDICKGPNYFKCHNNRCISTAFVCDAENDCGDYSDERDCENFKVTVNSECEEGHWKCTDQLCIPNDWVCNGVSECLDGSDETIGCSRHIDCDGFKCKNSHCVPNEWVCDGVNDCNDNSDEQDCENHVPFDKCIPDNGKYLCQNKKTCIDTHLVCNGVDNCPDRSDEGGMCNSSFITCQHLKCSHACVPLPTGPKCVCPAGHVSHDNNCTDINECDTYGICDQMCRNTVGSYECYCSEKYYLESDKRTCKARGGNGLMIFSTKKEIRALTLDSKSYFTVANDLKQVVGVDTDGVHVFWTEIFTGHESIVKSIEDGSEREMIVTSGLNLPEDLSVDWLTGNIYFTDAEKQHIGVCTNTGVHCTILINKDIRVPRGIVVNVDDGDMYWTDWGIPAEIGYSLMDGSGDRPFVKDDIHWPNGIALDRPNRRLYWTDAKKKTLESIALDGTDRRIVLEEVTKHPYAIAVFENQLFWSDWDTHTIQTCDKFDGKNHRTLVDEHKDLIYGIAIFHSALHERKYNPCERALCSDICLLRGQNYTCACPENKMLGVDKHVCKEIIPNHMLIGATGNLLMHIEHQHLGKHDISILPSVVEHAGSLAFDSNKNILFVSDKKLKKIVTLNLHTGFNKTLDISGLGQIIAMDFDVTSNNLYICDLDRLVVEVISLNTMAKKVLMHDTLGEIPESIVLVPEEGVMFISFHNEELKRSHIDRFTMDGAGRTHIIEEQLTGSISMMFDRELNRIFFADAQRGTIDSFAPEGDSRHSFHSLNTHPVSLTSSKDYVFWINGHSKELYWTEKKAVSSYDKKIVLGVSGEPERIHLISAALTKMEPNACRVNNNGCSHLCLLSHKSIVCDCPIGWELSTNNHTCIKRVDCDMNEFLCPHSNLCIPKKFRCNGHMDCSFGEDEINCEPISNCSAGQFQCTDGQCIQNYQVCDHIYDCQDKSDEQKCESGQDRKDCPPGHFRCNNSECVSSTFVCDGHADCDDSSDEHNCIENICFDNQFRCDSGACIPKAWECDRAYDCPDNSDEHCALDTCSDDFFKCENYRCIDKKLLCDGVDDCGDHSDETLDYCHHYTKSSGCSLNEMECSSNTSICIPISAKCNGTSECPNNEDEIGCSRCAEEEFECASKNDKECIPKSWMCDGTNDCNDNSDEDVDLCSHKIKTVLVASPVADHCINGYRCKNGACLNMSLVCNGKHDCYDGSDEDGLCSDSCTGTANPCEQVCLKTPAGPQCRCKLGYKLRGDGKLCEDDNECQWDPPVCSQLCHNKDGGYTCDCYNNFFLGSDKKSCKADGTRMSMYFIVHDYQIRELISKSNAMTIISTTPMIKISSLQALVEPKTVFFSTAETGAIYKLDINTNMMHIIRHVGKPQKIAIDWSTQNVYFYNDDSIEKSISVCSFEEKCAKLIDIDAHRQVSALAVDSINKVLFYVLRNWWILDSPNYVIYKTNLDGSNKTEIVETALGNIEDITLDINKQILYFKDHQAGTINSVSYRGGLVKPLFSNVNETRSLQFYENQLYYYQSDGFIISCKLYDGRTCSRRIKLNSFTNGNFIISQSSLQPKTRNICEGHKCPYLCIPTKVGFKCLCHDGKIGNITDVCVEEYSYNQHRFTVHSTPINSNITKKHSAAIVTAVLVPLFLLLIGVIFYYVIKRKNNTGLNISMRFYNPLYGKPVVEDPKSILQPGQHEYENPIIITDEQLVEDHSSKLLNETRFC
ncbi:vitellogenin receptor [Diorhabda carinulata]|uniref:vitellogenin receptor n=1 Tax=Diorhabda carinulata TaxID=1163345 RepID=UPI00259FF6ED|nr:vitellogenin receptor [Diorhabda carinulata]